MKKKQPWQKIAEHIESKGIKKSWIARKIKMSTSHLHFILKGDRLLTDEKKEKINSLLETNF